MIFLISKRSLEQALINFLSGRYANFELVEKDGRKIIFAYPLTHDSVFIENLIKRSVS